jgi:hypothetical protein
LGRRQTGRRGLLLALASFTDDRSLPKARPSVKRIFADGFYLPTVWPSAKIFFTDVLSLPMAWNGRRQRGSLPTACFADRQQKKPSATNFFPVVATILLYIWQ